MTGILTILGCGSSGGVPRIGNDWGVCDPREPRNRRRRCSILLQKIGLLGTTNVLIDTSPDMREQMLGAHVDHLDGVWYTHEHADHTHGIDELRVFFIRQRKPVPIWADDETAKMLQTRFKYIFETNPGSDYPVVAIRHGLNASVSVTTHGAGGDITALPIQLNHGNIDALGFRIGNVAYTPDVKAIPDESIEALLDLDTWIIDALRPAKHPSHFSLEDALSWIERLQPKQAIITNMHVDMDYATLLRNLPANVTPAYDGLSLNF